MKDFFQEAGPFYMVQRDKMAPEELVSSFSSHKFLHFLFRNRRRRSFSIQPRKSCSNTLKIIWSRASLVGFATFSKDLWNLGFFVDSGVTWIDLFVADQLITIESIDAKILAGHPEVGIFLDFSSFYIFVQILKLRDQVLAIPEIKEWIAKRPQTPF